MTDWTKRTIASICSNWTKRVIPYLIWDNATMTWDSATFTWDDSTGEDTSCEIWTKRTKPSN